LKSAHLKKQVPYLTFLFPLSIHQLDPNLPNVRNAFRFFKAGNLNVVICPEKPPILRFIQASTDANCTGVSKISGDSDIKKIINLKA
jgi:hypothetical protein